MFQHQQEKRWRTPLYSSHARVPSWGTSSGFGSSSECAHGGNQGVCSPQLDFSLLTATLRYPRRQWEINCYRSNGFGYQDLGRACAGWATTALLSPPRAQLWARLISPSPTPRRMGWHCSSLGRHSPSRLQCPPVLGA